MKLAIDPGHGNWSRRPMSFDPGAVGNGFREADIALQWALTGKFLCEKADIEVFLTRPDNEFRAPLGKRVQRAKEAGCDYLISIHCNSFNAHSTGVETFYRSGADFASYAQSALLKATGLRNRGLKHESQSQHSSLAILGGGLTSCLIEIGFISNPNDVKVMTSRDVRVAFWNDFIETLR